MLLALAYVYYFPGPVDGDASEERGENTPTPWADEAGLIVPCPRFHGKLGNGVECRVSGRIPDTCLEKISGREASMADRKGPD